MALDGAGKGHIPVVWMTSIENLPKPPEIMSERVKSLLSRALVGPIPLTQEETRELAASVVFHLMKIRADDGLPPGQAKHPQP